MSLKRVTVDIGILVKSMTMNNVSAKDATALKRIIEKYYQPVKVRIVNMKDIYPRIPQNDI